MLNGNNLHKLNRKAELLLVLLISLAFNNAFSGDEVNKKSADMMTSETNASKSALKKTYQPRGDYKDVEKLLTDEEEFRILDLNNDGVVSLSESKSEYALNNAFATVDRNGNNEISLDEFRQYYHVRYGSIANTKPLKHLNSKERAKKSFRRYDANEDGYISIHEFSEMTGKGSDGIPDKNQKKPSGVSLKGQKYDPDPAS